MDQLRHFGINTRMIRGDTKSYNAIQMTPKLKKQIEKETKFEVVTYPNGMFIIKPKKEMSSEMEE
jgi:hypothetical protein